MPNKLNESEGDDAKRQAREPAPFGPAFPEPVVAVTAKLETWGSSFTDAGGDWCEFRAFNASGEQIATRRIDGY